jgi:hypothetical protein
VKNKVVASLIIAAFVVFTISCTNMEKSSFDKPLTENERKKRIRITKTKKKKERKKLF